MTSVNVAKTAVSTTTALSPQPFQGRTVGNRYRVAGPLGKDHAEDLSLATDTVTGNTVVIRWLATSDLSAGARAHWEHDVEILRNLKEPCLNGAIEIGQEGDRLYVVRPFVPGVSLHKRLQRGPLDLQETLTLGRCLFSAMKAAHAHGVFHRDIRPTNIIVSEQSPVSNAVLINFGVGYDAGTGTATSEDSLDIARYSSPEHAGLMDYDVGATSDLYSAGIVLFEALSGHPPFSGNTVGAVLYTHMTSHVPDLRATGLCIPRPLDELIQRLLRKDPRDRYQTAEAVLFDLEGIVASLRGGARESDYVVGLRDHRGTLTEPTFVGHRSDLEGVDDMVLRASAGQLSFVLIEAESGGGKTRLLKEIALRGAQKGMQILNGCGLEMVGQRPFQVLHGVVEHVVAAATNDPAYAENLRKRLGDHVAIVSAVLPELAAVLGWNEPISVGPESFAESRSIQALAAFLGAIGTKDRPAMIVLDDCQWADATTVKLIAHLQKEHSNSVTEDYPMMLVVAYRSEEVPTGHPLRAIHCSLHLRLSPLRDNEVHDLLESMAGPLPEEAIDVVTRLSDGSPFMASAMLRGMVESGALVADSFGWRIEASALADLQSSSRSAGLLSQRIELLPQDTLEVATIGAVLGKEFDLRIAAKLLDMSPVQAAGILDKARARHLIWMAPDGEGCIFVHDKIRDALLARLTPERRREAHHRVAHYLQEEDPGRIFDLAYHFDVAGDYAAALPYAIQAAEQARSQHALEIAERLYRIAQRASHSAERETQFEIAKGLGDVLMLQGHYSEAGELFIAAMERAEGAFSEARNSRQARRIGLQSRRHGQRRVGIRAGIADARQADPQKHSRRLRQAPLGNRRSGGAHILTRPACRTLSSIAVKIRTVAALSAHPSRLCLLVYARKGTDISNSSGRDESGRALPADAGVGAPPLVARHVHDPLWHVWTRFGVRPEVARCPQGPRRPLGAGTVAQLLRLRVVCRVPIQ